jgi:hypothetical protein
MLPRQQHDVDHRTRAFMLPLPFPQHAPELVVTGRPPPLRSPAAGLLLLTGIRQNARESLARDDFEQARTGAHHGGKQGRVSSAHGPSV